MTILKYIGQVEAHKAQAIFEIIRNVECCVCLFHGFSSLSQRSRFLAHPIAGIWDCRAE